MGHSWLQLLIASYISRKGPCGFYLPFGIVTSVMSCLPLLLNTYFVSLYASVTWKLWGFFQSLFFSISII
ncbi:hypothetical protein F4809DRAFT_588519 [Biscogniauxia mediterranea]|nr:hypothetical protein F4809DRAFT_588519 [Biscogniauxia mediterranea]